MSLSVSGKKCLSHKAIAIFQHLRVATVNLLQKKKQPKTCFSPFKGRKTRGEEVRGEGKGGEWVASECGKEKYFVDELLNEDICAVVWKTL